MTRCIHCTRCVRFSEEISGTSSFGTLNRGKNTEIGAYISNIFNSEISGNVIDLCPVGALTSKPYAFKACPWELRCNESFDFTDGLGTSILVNYKETDIVRIQPKFDKNLENLSISDKIRFSFDSLKIIEYKIFLKKVLLILKKQIGILLLYIFLIFFLKNDKTTLLINGTLDLESIVSLKLLTNYFKNLNIISFEKNLISRNFFNFNNKITETVKSQVFLLFCTEC
jgi:NADH dehydrogenase/NADH:ubiquinone oxidoreductase subunit G